MSVYEKLMNVQAELKAPKGQYNSFGKYNFRSCEDILEAVKPLLKANKLSLNISDEIILIGDRFYIKATATVTDVESEDKTSSSALAREDETKKGMDLAQVTGSVSSYARKYALNGLFCIDDNKDSDSTNTHGKEGKKADKQPNKEEQPNKEGKKGSNQPYNLCTGCSKEVNENIAKFSNNKYKKILCIDCQKKVN